MTVARSRTSQEVRGHGAIQDGGHCAVVAARYLVQATACVFGTYKSLRDWLAGLMVNNVNHTVQQKGQVYELLSLIFVLFWSSNKT